MIIDADCHISSHRFNSVAITVDDLIPLMDRSGVDKALVWLAPPYDRNIAPENEAVFAAAQRFPDRLLPFGWANPRLGQGATCDTIKRCFEEYGFLGIKFNGAQDDYVIDDAAISLPCIEVAARYGKPLAFHIGADSYENTHPYRLGCIAKLFPGVEFLMVHMGGVAKPSLARAAIEVAQQNPNITLIASEISSRDILQAIERLGADRVCFGSDTPFELLHVELSRYDALLRDCERGARTKIMGGNIARVLGI